jgi:hypothetical protein
MTFLRFMGSSLFVDVLVVIADRLTGSAAGFPLGWGVVRGGESFAAVVSTVPEAARPHMGEEP